MRKWSPSITGSDVLAINTSIDGAGLMVEVPQSYIGEPLNRGDSLVQRVIVATEKESGGIEVNFGEVATYPFSVTRPRTVIAVNTTVYTGKELGSRVYEGGIIEGATVFDTHTTIEGPVSDLDKQVALWGLLAEAQQRRSLVEIID